MKETFRIFLTPNLTEGTIPSTPNRATGPKETTVTDKNLDPRSVLLAAYILGGLRLLGPSTLATMFDGAGLNRNSVADQRFFCKVLAGLNTCGYITGPNENLDERGVPCVGLTEQGEAKADEVEAVFALHGAA